MNQALKIGSSVAGVAATIGSIWALFPKSEADWEALGSVNKLCYVLLILACLALIANSIVEITAQVRYHHCFECQTEKFNKYFSQWYKKPGRLCIICDDLDWTITGEDRRIYDQLEKKCNPKEGLLLLLGRGMDSPIAKQLEGKGAVIRPGPENVISQFSFSCINVMGNPAGKAIVRNKRNDRGNKIISDEIRDKYVTELLNTLINK